MADQTGIPGVTASGGKMLVTLGSVLAVSLGGTGLASYAIGDLLYASGATTLARLANIATGNALISGGVGVAPSYGKIGLTTHVSGTLAVGNGGTGATSITGLVLGNGASAMSAYGGVSNTNYAILALNANGAATKDTLLTLGPTNVTLVSGQVLLPNGTNSAPSLSFTSQTGFGWYWVAGDTMAIGADGVNQFSFRGGDFAMVAVAFIEWASIANSQGEIDLLLGREGAAILQQGRDSTTPIAQTYKGPDGSGTNIAGGDMTVASGRGTGTGPGGTFRIATAPPGASGSAQNALVDRFTINGAGNITIGKLMESYNGVAAEGAGFLAIRKKPAILTGQTTTVASVGAITTPNDAADHEYLIAGFLNVTSYTSGTINLQVSYTDHAGVAQTKNITLAGDAGTTAGGATSGGYWQGLPIYISADPNTAVTIKTAGTFTATYDVGATITQVN